MGLFILVMAAIVFAAILYRRRRSAHLMAMSALLQQQALDPSYEGEVPDLAGEYLYQTEAGNPNTSADANFTNPVGDNESGSNDHEGL